MSTVAWAAWVALVTATALTATNPYVLGILLAAVALVAVAAPRTERAGLGLRVMLALGLGLFAFSIGAAMLNTGFGERTLFTLPRAGAPDWLGGLALGGDVTAEALTAGALRGAVVLAVLLGFAVFSGAVSAHAVLRLAPAALFHAGLVVAIGLALLPATVADLRRIREMRALRGHPTGVRGLPALVVPAVMGGLDRAMRFAEAMEARGYAAPSPLPARTRLAGLAAAPLFAAAAWIWFYFPEVRWIGGAAALAGAGALVLWGWDSARCRRVTRLAVEREPLPLRIAALLSLTGAFAVVAADLGGWAPGGYNPFAGFPAPEFSALAATPAIAVLWPLPFLAAAPRPRARREAAVSIPAPP